MAMHLAYETAFWKDWMIPPEMAYWREKVTALGMPMASETVHSNLEQLAVSLGTHLVPLLAPPKGCPKILGGQVPWQVC